jgi:uncharacterized membrane protein HdeD (DUF308 family)
MPNLAFTPLPDQELALFGDLKKNWGWLLAFGILSVVLGTIGLGATATYGLTLITVIFFGWLLIVGGGFQLIDAFYCKGWKGVLAQVLTALLYVLAGYLIIQDPILASSTFTLIIAAVLIAVGLLRSFTAFQHRALKGWVWSLLGGLISILLGAMIIAKWPASGLWVIGLFVAIELLLNGWSAIFIALAARRAHKADQAKGAAA